MGGTTWYLHGDNNALVFEKELKANGVTENRHYLQAAGMTFALVTTRSGAGVSSTASDLSKRSAQVRYFHQDHLNSMAVITDEAGQVVERLAYDPWGKRRNANGLADKSDSLVGQTTDRGYTEHEHLDEVGLIHMNGRVYDPLIGRFMSADPFIQSPGNLQSYNRYAYVMNNPLALTDPSGYFSLKKFFRAAVTIAVAYYTGQWVGDAVMWSLAPTSANAAAIGAIAGGAAGGAAAGVTGAALNGANLSQSLQAGLQGGLTGALFGAAGGVGSDTSFARYAAHAGAGCISSVASGGNCGQGAASAVFGKFTTNAISGWGGNGTSGVIARGVATAVAGGVGSVIAGGKFANGAETAAYGYLFNECQHTRACGSDSTKVNVTGNRVLGDMAHSEIQISSGYDFVVLEGQPGYSNGNNRLEGRSNGANQGDAFSVGLSSMDGRTMAQFAGDLQTAAASYNNNLSYSFPSFRFGFSNLNGGYNSNSYVGGVLDAAAPNAGFRYVVQGSASRAGFRVPGMENPIPLSPVR